MVGCAVGVAVFLGLSRFQESTRLLDAIAECVDAVATMAPHLAEDTGTLAARTSRRDLQLAIIDLRDASDAAAAGSTRLRATGERLGPAAVAAERLAYRTVAACWEMDGRAADPLLGTDEAEAFLAQLRGLASALRARTDPPVLVGAPAVPRRRRHGAERGTFPESPLSVAELATRRGITVVEEVQAPLVFVRLADRVGRVSQRRHAAKEAAVGFVRVRHRTVALPAAAAKLIEAAVVPGARIRVRRDRLVVVESLLRQRRPCHGGGRMRGGDDGRLLPRGQFGLGLGVARKPDRIRPQQIAHVSHALIVPCGRHGDVVRLRRARVDKLCGSH